MAKRQATRRPSPRQQEILDEMNDQPGIHVKEIAKRLNTTEGAVYQHISRLRSAKLLPTKKAGKRRPQLKEPEVKEVAPTNVRVKLSLEDHLASELIDTVGRIEELSLRRIEIDAEEQSLTRRREQLAAAQEALTPTPF